MEKGYKAATIDDVAARVGLLPGSLYYYINSKEDLLFEMAHRLIEQSLTITHEDPKTANSKASDRLVSLIQRWMETIRSSQPWAAWNLLDEEVRTLDKKRVTQLKAQRHVLRTFIEGILVQGIRSGDFDPDMNLAVVVNSTVRLLWSTSQWYEESGSESFEEITAWYQKFILRGIGYKQIESIRTPSLASMSR